MKKEATGKSLLSRRLLKAKSARFPYPLPIHYRLLGWMLVMFCAFAFYLGPLLWILPPFVCLYLSRKVATIICVSVLILTFSPVKPWPAFRSVFELWYEMFDFHHNITEEFATSQRESNNLVILAMHPHGVIPMHGFLWSAFCEQYLPGMYGFGATTSVVTWLPVLRQLLGWLSAGSADKHVLLRGMQKGGENLFILPGGVAEIFMSKRNLADKNIHTIKGKRYGLMKLALQTGASIIPLYVFGGTEFFDQIATVGESAQSGSSVGRFLQSFSRRMKGGMTLFWGQYGTVFPYCPKVSFVFGDPIVPVPGTEGRERNMDGSKVTCQKIENPTQEQVEELMDRYTGSLRQLFDQYKDQAGYKNDELKIE